MRGNIARPLPVSICGSTPDAIGSVVPVRSVPPERGLSVAGFRSPSPQPTTVSAAAPATADHLPRACAAARRALAWHWTSSCCQMSCKACRRWGGAARGGALHSRGSSFPCQGSASERHGARRLTRTLSAAYRAANGSRNGRGKTLPFQKPDAVDQHILSILEDNGRATNREIAESVGVSEGTVRNRIERLIRDDILRIVGVTNPARLGLNTAAVISISAELARITDIAERIAAADGVVYVGYTTGNADIIVLAFFPSNDELTDFMTQTLAAIPGHPEGRDEHHSQAGAQPLPGRDREPRRRASRRVLASISKA